MAVDPGGDSESTSAAHSQGAPKPSCDGYSLARSVYRPTALPRHRSARMEVTNGRRRVPRSRSFRDRDYD